MMFFYLLSWILLTFAANATEIPCESVGWFLEYPRGNIPLCCLLNRATTIKSRDVTISSSSPDAAAVEFSYNRKISFLPIQIYQTFPSLLYIWADRCAIREISKSNFEKLAHLQVISLNENLITKIERDTFADLQELVKLDLQKNKIKFMDPNVFEGPPDLRIVFLLLNDCINMNVESPAEIKGLTRFLEESCDFEEKILTSKVKSRAQRSAVAVALRCWLAILMIFIASLLLNSPLKFNLSYT